MFIFWLWKASPAEEHRSRYLSWGGECIRTQLHQTEKRSCGHQQQWRSVCEKPSFSMFASWTSLYDFDGTVVSARKFVPCAWRHGTPKHYQGSGTYPRTAYGAWYSPQCRAVPDNNCGINQGTFVFTWKTFRKKNSMSWSSTMKICPPENNTTGILVILDQFSDVAEAVPDNLSIVLAKMVFQTWHTLRSVLTLLRVFCVRLVHDGDQHLDEVLCAYNSTRHANSGFSPYMLTRGTKKVISIIFLYPKFAAKSFETYMDEA